MKATWPAIEAIIASNLCLFLLLPWHEQPVAALFFPFLFLVSLMIFLFLMRLYRRVAVRSEIIAILMRPGQLKFKALKLVTVIWYIAALAILLVLVHDFAKYETLSELIGGVSEQIFNTLPIASDILMPAYINTAMLIAACLEQLLHLASEKTNNTRGKGRSER